MRRVLVASAPFVWDGNFMAAAEVPLGAADWFDAIGINGLVLLLHNVERLLQSTIPQLDSKSGHFSFDPAIAFERRLSFDLRPFDLER